MIKTKQELLNHFTDINAMYNNPFMYQTLSNMIDELLEQQPCEDCISRENLLNSIEEPMNWTDSEAEIQEQKDYENFVALVKSMPPVTPQPKTGHWIAGVDRWGDIVTTVNGYRCSECCAFNADKDNYCPNCGAKMDADMRGDTNE